ncbi:MAG: PTS sugar transporter subunit IIC [Gemmatimonadota bacterium]
MTLETMDLLLLGLLGGILGLDTVSCIQAMISRPIVAGPLAGLLLGDPVAGMYAGSLLELVSLSQLPIGASRSWDTGPASVAAAAVAAAHPVGAVVLLVAVGYGVLVGWAGSRTVHLLRTMTAGLVASEGQQPISPFELSARHLSAVAIEFLRAASLTLVAVIVAGPISAALGAAPATASAAAAVVILVSASLALGGDVRMMARGRSVQVAFGAGLLVSAVTLLIWLV